MAAYQFRTMSADDLPLLRTWLARPHVREWWGDPREQFELVRDDLDDPTMEQFILATADRPPRATPTPTARALFLNAQPPPAHVPNGADPCSPA